MNHSIKFLRQMCLDDFADLVLRSGRYDVDVESAVVVNTRTGRVLKQTVVRWGYSCVTLSPVNNVFRLIRVHRLVAIKHWGVDAVRGKEVGHLRGVSAGNGIGNLWIPKDRREHNEFDGHIERIQQYAFEPKRSWLPCAHCGDPDGAIRGHHRTPDRMDGTRFGVNGAICRACYGLFYQRYQRSNPVWNEARNAKRRAMRTMGGKP